MSLNRICVRKEKLKCPKIPHCPKIPVVTLVSSADHDLCKLFPDKMTGDQDINCLTLKEFFKKVDFDKNQQSTKNYAKYPSRQRVNP